MEMKALLAGPNDETKEIIRRIASIVQHVSQGTIEDIRDTPAIAEKTSRKKFSSADG